MRPHFNMAGMRPPQWYARGDKLTATLGQSHVLSVTIDRPSSVMPLMREFHLLECLQDNPLSERLQFAAPVAESRFTSGGESYHAFVRTQVPGNCLKRWAEINHRLDDITPRHAERVGEIMGMLHHYGPLHAVQNEAPHYSAGSNFAGRLAGRMDKVAAALDWGKEERGILDRMISNNPAIPPQMKSVFTHRDVHVGNVIANQHGDITGVIDWENARRTSPLEDMAMMQPLPTQAALRLFLKGYRHITRDAPRPQDVLLAQTMRWTEVAVQQAPLLADPANMAAPRLKQDISKRIVKLAEDWMRESSVPVRAHKRDHTLN